MNKEVAEQITRARTGLILDQPFFGRLAMMLRLVEDSGVKTMAVDGKSIFYNPDFTATLSPEKTKTVIAHEVMHCVYDHMSRRDQRHPRTWNQAGDYVINLVLVDSGFTPVDNWLYSKSYAGMSTDEVYGMLPPPDDDDGNDPMDEVLDGAADDAGTLATDWKVATIQAANAAKEFGKMPASLSRLVEELTTVKVDWRALLRQFITERSKDDYSWMRPNRRFQSMGIMLPGLFSETMGEIVVAIDTSGSITQEMLNIFGAEIKAIVGSTRPSKTTVIYCDAEVNHVDEFGPNDDMVFAMHGGGGTHFAPPFAYVEQNDIKPVCFVYLTDLYGGFGPQPSYPVLWACTTTQVAPWGTTIAIDV